MTGMESGLEGIILNEKTVQCSGNGSKCWKTLDGVPLSMWALQTNQKQNGTRAMLDMILLKEKRCLGNSRSSSTVDQTANCKGKGKWWWCCWWWRWKWLAMAPCALCVSSKADVARRKETDEREWKRRRQQSLAPAPDCNFYRLWRWQSVPFSLQ